VCDAVLCGGVDSLCKLTLNGFSAGSGVRRALQPVFANRNGINIGEAAVLFLMTRSRPHRPAGQRRQLRCAPYLRAGAQRQRRLAGDAQGLDSAGLQPAQIGYLNLHGTATQHNDAMESLAVASLFPKACPALDQAHDRPHPGRRRRAGSGVLLVEPEPMAVAAPRGMARRTRHCPPCAGPRPTPGPRYLMSNSFAFGGNNVSLIIGDAP
jgi:3-oxoacyl-[acyl-carrier-protein] synthase-1